MELCHSLTPAVLALQVDEDGSKEIEFQEFVHAIQINKALSEKTTNEQETLDAFVALGGNVGGSMPCVCRTIAFENSVLIPFPVM